MRKSARIHKSQFVQIVRHNKEAIIWHSLFGNPKIVSLATLNALNFFSRPKTIHSFLSSYTIDKSDRKCLQDLIDEYYLIPDGFNERLLLLKEVRKKEKAILNGSLINNLGLIVSSACNFNCDYCIHFNNLKKDTVNSRLNSKMLMSFETAKTAIDAFISILRNHKKNVIEINFGGGEPLLNWQIIKGTLDYCKSAYPDMIFRFSINTNASLITEEIARGLKKYKVRIASSLDGVNDDNDQVRIFRSGEGTFDAIIKGFEILATNGNRLDGISITINDKNFSCLDTRIVDFALQRKMKEIRIDVDVVGMLNISVTKIADKIMKIRQYAAEYGIEVFGFWSRPVENMNYSVFDAHIAFCGAVRGSSICVDASGSAYGCGYSTIRLGHISDLKSLCNHDGLYYRFVKSHLVGEIKRCIGCEIEGQCIGGCNITEEFADNAKTSKIRRMCNFYRIMTRRLLVELLTKRVQQQENKTKGGNNEKKKPKKQKEINQAIR